MRAVQIFGAKDIRMVDVPVPEPGEDELLLKVASVCICGSDLHYYLEGGVNTKRIIDPQIPGHEIAAWICDDRAEQFGFRNGQLVAVEPTAVCGKCEHCLNGRPNLCQTQRFYGGPPHQGALAEYFKAGKEMIIPVPEAFSPAVVATLEAVGIGIHALKKADLQLGQSVAVLGAGPIGLIVLQLARAHGAGQIIVVDPVAFRRQKALELGADAAVASYESIADLTGGHGPDLVVEATNSPDAFTQAVKAVKWAGRIVLVGIPTGNDYNPIDAISMRSKEVTVLTCNKMGHVYPETIEVVRRGLVNVDALLTHHVGIEESIEAYNRQAAHEEGVLKTVIYPNGILPHA